MALVRDDPSGVANASCSTAPVNQSAGAAFVANGLLGVVSAFNPSQTLGVYPGSPLIAQSLLRPQDRLIACELEPTSATSLAAEAKNPKRDIPRAVILSLIIQGLFAYLLEYFAANFAVSEKLVSTAADGSAVSGMAAVAASGAPIGDMVKLMGDALLGGKFRSVLEVSGHLIGRHLHPIVDPAHVELHIRFGDAEGLGHDLGRVVLVSGAVIGCLDQGLARRRSACRIIY